MDLWIITGHYSLRRKAMMRTRGQTQEITYLRKEKVQFEIWYSKTQFKAILPLSHTWL